MSRIAKRFDALRAAGRPGLVTYIAAGDPDPETSQAILDGLPEAGADLVELGMPFTDPMADGPAIQAAALRALRAGQTLGRTLEMAAAFRKKQAEIPLILMGYYNPIHSYGVGRFLGDAKAAGVDGLIVVDLPMEEDDELKIPADGAGLDFIRLVSPVTDERRLRRILTNASGFVYYVSITGITGTVSADAADVAGRLARIREASTLPVAVGFGVRTPDDVAAMGAAADAVVVGSAIVHRIAAKLDGEGQPAADLVASVLDFVAALAEGVRKTVKEGGGR